MAEQATIPLIPPPFQQTIVLNNGQILNGSAGQAGNYIWIWLEDPITFSEACEIFEDKEKTNRIEVNISAIETLVYIGYTDLRDIKKDDGGKVSIKLTQEVT